MMYLRIQSFMLVIRLLVEYKGKLANILEIDVK